MVLGFSALRPLRPFNALGPWQLSKTATLFFSVPHKLNVAGVPWELMKQISSKEKEKYKMYHTLYIQMPRTNTTILFVKFIEGLRIGI